MNIAIDQGLNALVYAAQRLDKVADKRSLKHRIGHADPMIDKVTLCRCANWLGLKAQYLTMPAERLAHLPCPAILRVQEGCLVLLQVRGDQALLFCAQTQKSLQLSLDELVSRYTGHVILLAEQRTTVQALKFGFQWFIPSIKKHAEHIRRVILISVLIQLIALVTPILFEKVIDKVLVTRSLSSLHVLGIALLSLALFEPLYNFMRGWLFTNLASKVNSELSARLYDHLIRLPLSYFNQRQTGQITARMREMDQIRQFLSGSALTLILDLVFVSIFIAVLLTYAPTLTAVILGSLVLYFLFWLAIGPSLRHRVTKEYEEMADNTAFLTESITGIETIKTHAVEPRFAKHWQQKLAHQLKAGFHARLVAIWAEQGIGLIQKLTSAFVLWLGVKLVMSGDLTAGELVAFNMLSSQVTQPILRLAQIWQDFQHTLISLKRVGDILDEPKEAGSAGLASMPKLQGAVEFHQVRFKYNADSAEVISQLNLKIKAGEFIGITGHSGSGKSTLTKLLQRLYHPSSGEVLVDGMDLAIADPVELRRNMSVVLQESCLFSGSVADNIRQCLPLATDEAVQHAAQLAGAHEFIMAMPEGYQAQVGENGSRLSGGQRQRIALARALITDPKILILDEATSALDYESEAAILEHLPDIVQNRTVISIAHRLNTIRTCDRIIVMDRGRVIEQGSHQSLLEQLGQYAKLNQLQQV